MVLEDSCRRREGGGAWEEGGRRGMGRVRVQINGDQLHLNGPVIINTIINLPLLTYHY